MTRVPVTARRKRRRWLRRAVIAVVLVAVFAVGVALGMALHDNPRPGPPVTVERTVELPSAPGR